MFRFDARLKVYVHREAVDFRKSINGLAALVEQALGLDPFAAALYVFGNRRRDRVKILGWETNGFWLLLGIQIAVGLALLGLLRLTKLL